VAINGGHVKVDENKTLCLVDGAVALSEDSNLSKAIKEAKELLQKAGESNVAIASAISKVESMGQRYIILEAIEIFVSIANIWSISGRLFLIIFHTNSFLG